MEAGAALRLRLMWGGGGGLSLAYGETLMDFVYIYLYDQRMVNDKKGPTL
jgi:hypothetical protein